MSIRLIVTDLDGTLMIPHTYELSPRVYAALTRAAERGVYLVPATGRSLDRSPEWAFEFPFVRYLCVANGSRIMDARTGRTLYKASIPRETVYKVLECIYPFKTQGFVMCDGFSVQEDRRGPEGSRHISHHPFINTDMITFLRHRPELNVEKIDYYFDEPEERLECLHKLDKLDGLSIGSAYNENVEINPAGSDKGGSILRLSEITGIPVKEIMCLGDGLNDLSMFNVGAFAVAMGNAVPELLAVASAVTDTCENDGAAKAIEKYVLGL